MPESPVHQGVNRIRSGPEFRIRSPPSAIGPRAEKHLPPTPATLRSPFRAMISWIQKYFQHHFKTVFAILLAVTIVSFIMTIGAAPGIGRADRRAIDRNFFGYNLNRADDQHRLGGDASISADLQL